MVYSGDMHTGSFYVAVPLAVALVYAVAAVLSWRSLRAAQGAGAASHRPPVVAALLSVAVIAHAALLGHEMFGETGLRFGFAFSISATLLAAVGLLWIEGWLAPLAGLDSVVAPMAAVAVVLPSLFPGEQLGFRGDLQAAHLVLAVLAYSLFTLAAVMASLMAAIDRHLHRPKRPTPAPLAPILDRMPPLLSLERLLFRQILVGFLLLSATLASGILFSEELFGRPLRFDHMTFFAIVAWLIFAALLAGRRAFGWRGRVAQRWVFTGFFVLLLAYVGSRFVFEVVLGKGWV